MAKYSIADTTLTAIADAIREKAGNSDAMTPAQMAEAIAAMETGGGVPGILAAGSIVPAEDISDNEIDTGVVLNGNRFVLWYGQMGDKWPNSSYIAVTGYGQSSSNYAGFGTRGDGDKYIHSNSFTIKESTRVVLPGSVANFSYTLRAGYQYYWFVHDSSFKGLG